MNRESMFEPRRGGMVVARADAAPTELGRAVEVDWCYKDIAPMELGSALDDDHRVERTELVANGLGDGRVGQPFGIDQEFVFITARA